MKRILHLLPLLSLSLFLQACGDSQNDLEEGDFSELIKDVTIAEVVTEVAPDFVNTGTKDDFSFTSDLENDFHATSRWRSPQAQYPRDLGGDGPPRGEPVEVGASCEPLDAFVFSIHHSFLPYGLSDLKRGVREGEDIFGYVTKLLDSPHYAAVSFHEDRGEGDEVTVHGGINGDNFLIATRKVYARSADYLDTDTCAFLFNLSEQTVKSLCVLYRPEDFSPHRLDITWDDSYKEGSTSSDFRYQLMNETHKMAVRFNYEQTGPDSQRIQVDNTKGLTKDSAGFLGGFFLAYKKADVDVKWTPVSDNENSWECKITDVHQAL